MDFFPTLCGIVFACLVLYILGSLIRSCCYHNGGTQRRKRVNGSILVVGVTGPPGSGKSLFGTLCGQEGIDVIDTDIVVHQLMREDTDVRNNIRLRFGDEVFDATGAIDRKKLGARVFKDKPARHDLEAILHPPTIIECRRQIELLEKAGKWLVFVQVPLLFEAKLECEYDKTAAIIVDKPILKARLKTRNLTDAEVEERLAAQLPQEEKARRADFVIPNSGTVEELHEKVRLLIKMLKELKG